MAGGNWNVQNKVRPGVYINFNQNGIVPELSQRGIVTMPLNLNWGPEQEVIVITKDTDTFSIFGEPLENIVPLREALKRAEKLLIYRLNSYEVDNKANITSGNLTATAKYTGTLGNSIKIIIEANGEAFNVKTYAGTTLADIQEEVSTVADLEDNEFVFFSGTGDLAATSGVTLSGGVTVAITVNDYSAYRSALEVYAWNVCGLYGITDETTKAVFKEWIQRLRDDEGYKVIMVTENYTTADYEGVISVKNGVILEDGTTLTAPQVIAWLAGACAAANTNKSLTYDYYDGAVEVGTKYTNSQIETALNQGEFLFTANNNKARIEYDINTLHTFTIDKGRMFSKNRVMRTLDAINNDLVKIGEDYFIGKIDNNSDGRNLLKNEIIKYLEKLRNNGSIREIDTQNDIIVSQGSNSDSVLINVSIQPVDSIEKLFMSVEVN